MKNLFKLIPILAIMLIIFSCRSDDNSESSYSSKIIGKWKLTDSSTNGQKDYLDLCEYQYWTNIKSGGSFDEYDACIQNTRINAGTWEIKGNIFTIIDKSFPIPFACKIITLTNTSLVLEYDGFSNEKVKVTYTKIN